jgi:hypothetical protein
MDFENPVVTFTAKGTFLFSLKVTDKNNLLTDTAYTLINVIDPQKKQNIIAVTVPCASIDAIIENFFSNASSNELFRGLPQFEEINKFFTDIKKAGISSKSTAAQIEILINSNIDSLTKWIENIVNSNELKKATPKRLALITLLKLLSQLTYYIVCIQNEDLPKTKPDMTKPLMIIADLFSKGISAISAVEKDVWQSIQNTTVIEIDRLIANWPINQKPEYLNLLNLIATR